MISQTLLDRLASANSVLFFTGAGVSAESGIATFRSPGGLWTKFSPQQLANVDAFLANPQLVWEWYQARRDVVLHAEPNPGHVAIAAMEQLLPKVSIVTQNIDGLHRAAGSSEVIELHGNIRRNYCQSCKEIFEDENFLVQREVPVCSCGGLVRPDVVWFGEMLPEDAYLLAEQRAQEADVCFVVGTSAEVYPAAAIPMIARDSGAYLCEINPEPTPLSDYAHESIHESSGSVLPVVVERLREMV